MTNEERRKAAEWFRNRAKNCPMPGARRMYEIATEALEMAIRALEGDGDTISRKAVMKEFSDFVRKSNNSDFAPTPTWNDAVSLVGSIPSAQPQRKKGKWINHRKDDGHNIADCDQCGNAIQWFDSDEIPRYCCMCGADMRGDEMIYPQVDGITSSII